MDFFDTLFMILKKGLVALVFVIFGFAATYVPQPYNHIDVAEAGPVATEITQIANNIQLVAINIINSAIAFATGSLWVKESILDAIAWVLSKGIVATMMADLVNWVNSGFEYIGFDGTNYGNGPNFIQNLEQYMQFTADQAVQEVNQIIGAAGPASFICDPFKLDIQIAVDLHFDVALDLDIPTISCDLSKYGPNFQNFIQGDFNSGGWDDWFDLVGNPQETPYGQLAIGIDTATVNVLNDTGEQAAHIAYGNGVFPQKQCSTVPGIGGPVSDCQVTNPGKIVQELTSFNVDSARQSLVAADEFNEILASLFTSITSTLFSGSAGLLGLTGGGLTGSIISNPSPPGPAGGTCAPLTNARNIQVFAQTQAGAYVPQLNAHYSSLPVSSPYRPYVLTQRDDAVATQAQAGAHISALDVLIAECTNPATTATRISEIISVDLPALGAYTQAQIDQKIANWESALNTPPAYPTTTPPSP